MENFNKQKNDIFLGIREESGSFQTKDETTGALVDRPFHYFLVCFALADVPTTQNTVSLCGFDVLGIEKTGSYNGQATYKDCHKIQADNISSIFGFDVPNCDVFEDKILKPCNVLFDRKGNISRVIFFDSKKV